MVAVLDRDENWRRLGATLGLHFAISTRDGGVSAGGFATLNVGYHVGDDPACVTENRRLLAAEAGYDAAALVAAQQVHDTRLAWVSKADRGRGAFGPDGAVPEADGLLVRDAGVPVAIQVADCAPVLIVDPVRRMLAVVHAGWRGALGGIAGAAVCALAEQGADPAELLAGIGPTLCPACLEIHDEVAAAARMAFGERAVVPGPVRQHLDLTAMLTVDLVASGVPRGRIYRHADCTRCRQDRFFSHRGQSGHAGRFALVAWWAGDCE